MPRTLTDKSFHRYVLTNGKPVIVQFQTAWCGNCHIMAPIIEELATEFEGQIRFYKMDADTSKEITQQYGIKELPTLLFFRNGEEVDRIIKAVPKQVINEKINFLLREE